MHAFLIALLMQCFCQCLACDSDGNAIIVGSCIISKAAVQIFVSFVAAFDDTSNDKAMFTNDSVAFFGVSKASVVFEIADFNVFTVCVIEIEMK